MTSDSKTGRTYIYYIKDDSGRTLGTVCLILGQDGKWNRGVAVCSDKDRFDKRQGRSVAIGRARRANGSKKSSLPVLKELDNGILRDAALRFYGAALKNYGLDLGFKSSHNAALTDFEKSLARD